MPVRMLVLIAAVGMSVAGCYATRVALHHNDLFNSRRPIDEVLLDPSTSEETREQLRLVKRIMQFAEADGLNTKGAYRYYIETKEPVVSYIVQAAYADKLVSKTWWFPFVGSVPYLGYFRKAERDAQAAQLEAQGFDVHLGGAGAFSSLGWFEDPLFSSMIGRNEAELAHLLFHELTHRTFWAPASIRFNENLAEYVGMELTTKYLRATGNDALIKRYEAKRRDKALFTEWLTSLRQELEKLFERGGDLSRDELLAKKKSVFDRYLRTPLRPLFRAADYIGDDEWNNALVLSASLYAPDTAQFASAHACIRGEPVVAFLKILEETTSDVGDPFLALDVLCRT